MKDTVEQNGELLH